MSSISHTSFVPGVKFYSALQNHNQTCMEITLNQPKNSPMRQEWRRQRILHGLRGPQTHEFSPRYLAFQRSPWPRPWQTKSKQEVVCCQIRLRLEWYGCHWLDELPCSGGTSKRPGFRLWQVKQNSAEPTFFLSFLKQQIISHVKKHTRISISAVNSVDGP